MIVRVPAHGVRFPREMPGGGIPTILAATGVLAAMLVGALLAVEPRFGIAALLLLVAVPLILVNLPLGVALWIPFAFVAAVPGAGLFSIGLLAVLIVAWLGVLSIRRRAMLQIVREHKVIAWLVVLLTAWVTLSIAWATDPGQAAANVWNWYLAVAAFAIVATTINRPRHLVIALVAIIFGVVAAAVVGYAPVGGDALTAPQDGRLAGGLGDPNYLAAAIVVAMALGAGLYLATSSSAFRWSLLATMAFLGASLIATGSRGGLIAGAISVMATLVVTRGSRVRLAAVIMAIVAATTIWAITASPSTLDRFREVDTGGTGRTDLWDVAWRMSEDHPWVGVGSNNFRVESPNYVLQPGSPTDIHLITEDPHVVHNIYLQQLAETGIIGLTLFLAFLAAVVRTTWRAIKRLEANGAERMAGIGRAIIVAQIGGLSASMFLSNAYEQVLWILLALAIVLAAVAGRTDSDTKIHP